MVRMRRLIVWACLTAGPLNLLSFADATPARRVVSERFKRLTRASPWRLVSSQPLDFNTHHPQGLVKIGSTLYVSSVEVRQAPARFDAPQGGFDRDPGAGVGHLFKVDGQGRLLADLPLGEGTIYHPGGIDFDGTSIWVPVAEYRPNSRSIIYRVDVARFAATEVFRYPDHIGGVAYDANSRTLYGISWGSRFFYRWTIDARGRVLHATRPPAALQRMNPSFYIDYQDCKSLGRSEMLCGGLSSYQAGRAGARFSLGGLELVDLTTSRPVHQIPFEQWTASGQPMTQNPFWIELTERGLRAYFLPEDERSTLYIFETIP